MSLVSCIVDGMFVLLLGFLIVVIDYVMWEE